MGMFKALTRHYAVKYFVILFIWTLFLFYIIKDNNKIGSYWEYRNTENIEIKEPHFDNSPSPNEMERIAAIEKELPSIPYLYWSKPPGKPLQKSKNCANFPSVLKLKYHNKYWQTYVKENITIQLYNAYYDKRAALPKGPVVQLLAMINTIPYSMLKQKIYCQLWYDDSREPNITIATESRSIWNPVWGKSKNELYPHLISCALPKVKVGSQIPKVVSLVSNRCDTATNSLRVHYEIPNAGKQQFAVCIKGMDFPYYDISARLVEWIELQFILGASKIYFYQLESHPNVTKVLKYYEQRGLIDVRPITLAGGEPSLANLQHYLLAAQLAKKRLNELIPYNDCFYRNLYRYDFIAVQDIDEVIMPLGNRTHWSELMEMDVNMRKKRCSNGYASYCFRNAYFSSPSNATPFASDIPRFMHMLQHVERNKTHMKEGINTKCFHRTAHVVTLHNHLSRSWLKVCPRITFNATVAQLQHYRERPVLNETVVDLSVWRFKDKLLQRSLDALEEIGFLRTRKVTDSSS